MEKLIGNYHINFKDFLGAGSYSKVYLGRVLYYKKGLKNIIISCSKNNRLVIID